jgi:hypothetical protein
MSLTQTFHDKPTDLVYPVHNMRVFIYHLLAISVLFMSTEGLWDMAKETHAHSDYYAHQTDANHQISADTDPLSKDCADHCQNVCHGHVSVIAPNSTDISQLASNSLQALNPTLFTSSTPAPPTPPPNA